MWMHWGTESINYSWKERFICSSSPAVVHHLPHSLVKSSRAESLWSLIYNSWQVSRSRCNLITDNLRGRTSRLRFFYFSYRNLTTAHPSPYLCNLHTTKQQIAFWIARCGWEFFPPPPPPLKAMNHTKCDKYGLTLLFGGWLMSVATVAVESPSQVGGFLFSTGAGEESLLFMCVLASSGLHAIRLVPSREPWKRLYNLQQHIVQLVINAVTLSIVAELL